MSSPSITQIRPTPLHTAAPPSAIRLIHVLLEAMSGRRALHQVRPLLSPRPFTRLAAYADTGLFKRMRIGPVRSQMPSERAVEATVSLLFAARPVSCAIRLDLQHDRWACTDLTVLHPAAMRAAA